mgnify:CR=1 FL=1|tara:strand:- start:628 stop:1188 length:561 start_codon:yes stop_codon:yes gene_type:complete
MPKFNKSKGFTLKSGNKIEPTSFFKGEVKINPSQDSGIYYKSPLEADDDETTEGNGSNNGENGDGNGKNGDKLEGDTNGDGVVDENDDPKEDKETMPPPPPDKPGTKAWKIAANALIGGFDAITGEKTKRPTINWGKHEEETDDSSPEDKVKELQEESTTFNWKNEDGTDKTIEEYNKWWDDKNKK